MTFQSFTQRVQRDIEAGIPLSSGAIVGAARSFYREQYDAIYKHHTHGESGSDVIHALSDLADDILTGLFDAALHDQLRWRGKPGRIALCALGGYGRRELSPQSDLDVCLVYEGRLDRTVRALNDFFTTSLWDIGFRSAFATRSLRESLHLVRNDMSTFSSYSESRLVAGNRNTFAKLQLGLHDRRTKRRAREYVPQKLEARRETLPKALRDAYGTEPNLKESAGGLRDYHTALWVFSFDHDVNSLDEAVGREFITPDEHLKIIESLDFIWRIRNELHFATGRPDDKLTFEHQRDIAQAFGYGEDIGSFMSDYYSAARTVRRLYRAARAAATGTRLAAPVNNQSSDGFYVSGGLLHLPKSSTGWFAHNPVRLMEAIWNCARHNVRLSRPTELSIRQNLYLVNDEFRQNNLVRRFFVATCNRPLQAGLALREAARCGLLEAYLPEFDAVRDILRYEDFHSYPTDEHTLRAVEAIADLARGDSPVQRCLREALENLSDPYILIMALLFHDLGKVEGDIHIEASVRITHEICQRLCMPEEDEERIAFLVHHHILMTTISQYRDIDDEETIQQFAKTMQSEQRLRALFLLSYADLSAVGPGVWNDWKGALLMRLYLRAVRVLLGRAETADEDYWRTTKADAIRAATPEHLRDRVEDHIRGLGQRYFVAYSANQIARHIETIERAKSESLVVEAISDTVTGTSEFVVCTKDRPGLFAAIAGALSSQLVDVTAAAAFTAPNGIVVDSFTVSDARNGTPLTKAQITRIEQILHDVLLDGAEIGDYMERARKKIFTLLQPKVPIRTRVHFDNDSSRSHTVVDIETGDRTGLLYDLSHALTNAHLDISSSRIVTDARRVRDSFYVSRNHRKLDDLEEQRLIEAAILEAIHPSPSETASGVTA